MLCAKLKELNEQVLQKRKEIKAKQEQSAVQDDNPQEQMSQVARSFAENPDPEASSDEELIPDTQPKGKGKRQG